MRCKWLAQAHLVQGTESRLLIQNFYTHLPALSQAQMRRCVKLPWHHKAAHSMKLLSCSFQWAMLPGKEVGALSGKWAHLCRLNTFFPEKPNNTYLGNLVPWNHSCASYGVRRRGGGGRWRKKRGMRGREETIQPWKWICTSYLQLESGYDQEQEATHRNSIQFTLLL